MSEHEHCGCFEPLLRNTPSITFSSLKRIISQESYYVNDKQLQTISKSIFSSFKTISKPLNVTVLLYKSNSGKHGFHTHPS